MANRLWTDEHSLHGGMKRVFVHSDNTRQWLTVGKGFLAARAGKTVEWQLADLNRGPAHFQCAALPTELSCQRRDGSRNGGKNRRIVGVVKSPTRNRLRADESKRRARCARVFACACNSRA